MHSEGESRLINSPPDREKSYRSDSFNVLIQFRKRFNGNFPRIQGNANRAIELG